MSYFSYKNNILYCEKVKISDIADKYGTPAYIYSKKTLSENFDAYANAFDKKSGLIKKVQKHKNFLKERDGLRND